MTRSQSPHGGRRLRLLWAVVALAAVAGIAWAVLPSTRTSEPPTQSSGTGVSERPEQPAGPAGSDATSATADVASRFAALERRRGARLGVMAIDTATGERIEHRADERFALASTVKVPLAATVLDRLSTRELERRVFWTAADLVDYSPVTELAVEDGATVRELINAALTLSDNTATNVLFDLVGGPGAVAEALAGLGDTTTSIDRIEPDLNDWRPGEVRDTTTPRALADTVRDLTVGTTLGRADRRVLTDDLDASVTGADLVRAGVPDSWRVGDKSGSASYGTRNDVAVVRPPGRAPWIVVVMTSHDEADAATDDALIARATEIVVDEWS